jgi:3-phytase
VDGRTGARLVVTTQRHEARVAVLRLVDKPGGKVGTLPVSTLDLPSKFTLPGGGTWSPCEDPGEGPQLEGSVIDSARGVLYTAQEDVGIWRVPLTATGFGKAELIDKVRSFGVPQRYDEATEECVADGPDPGVGGRWLTADAEGLTLAGHTLLASSQGDSRFVVYGHRTRDFRVVAGHGFDSVEHSDGAAASTAYLGSRFPHGLLVTHDGERRPAAKDPSGKDLATTGFAFVRLEDVVGR